MQASSHPDIRPANAPARPVGLGQMVLDAAAGHSGAAFRFPDDGTWREETYADLGRAVREVAGGLISLGVEPGDRVAILSDTRREWTLADCGTLCAGAVVVPVYQTNSPDECRYVLEHSGSRVVFCEDEHQLAKVEQVRADLPALEHIILFTGAASGAPALAELRRRGAALDAELIDSRSAAAGPEDVATIVYTSGTTGPPKGCVLTHRNVSAAVRMYGDALALGREPFSIFMFLPLAHVLARVAQFVVLDRGGTVAYWRRDPKRIVDDLAEARPTHFPSVPRVFEKIHARAAGAAEQSAVRGTLFRWAVRTGRATRAAERAGGRPGPILRAQHALADRLVLSRVRGLFGDRLRLALTGAAPVAREVLEFFDACGVPVLEGYGLTETCAAATLNTPSATRLGTVGRALAGEELRIAEDGEILIRGPNVFTGYHRNEEATREALDDGWLRSGDLGSLDADGYLTITGRKKDLIITSSGKNITPTNIENALRERPWISQAVVYGDNRPYLVALLTLDPEEAPALAQRLGVAADGPAMAADGRVREVLQAEVDEVNSRFARIEQVKRFDVLERDLTQAGGELTPTMKVKRPVVYDRYREHFDRLYE
jgi:long-chain acyl-CoA synthetase